MPDLHGWVTQQIDETERVARACTATDWRHVFDGVIVDRDTDGWQHAPDNARILSVAYERIYWSCSPPHSPDADHIVTHSPDNVLRRCAADWKILAAHPYTTIVINPQHGSHNAGFGCETCHDWDGVPEGRGNCDTILALAEGYGLTPDILATLDQPVPEPHPPARPRGPRPDTRRVPPALRGPNWPGPA